MARQRNNRQDAIRRLARTKVIRTQEDLAMELQLLGFSCGSGTVARDIADVGLRKVDAGMYVLGEDVELYRMVSQFATGCERAGNLVVIRSRRGVEDAMAEAVDEAALDGVMCAATGAGSVLVACRTDESARAVMTLVKLLMC